MPFYRCAFPRGSFLLSRNASVFAVFPFEITPPRPSQINHFCTHTYLHLLHPPPSLHTQLTPPFSTLGRLLPAFHCPSYLWLRSSIINRCPARWRLLSFSQKWRQILSWLLHRSIGGAHPREGLLRGAEGARGFYGGVLKTLGGGGTASLEVGTHCQTTAPAFWHCPPFSIFSPPSIVEGHGPPPLKIKHF